MTTVVTKGTNRASANARTAKAAQRTPLPPRGATSAPGKNVTAGIIKDQIAETATKTVKRVTAAASKPVVKEFTMAPAKSTAKRAPAKKAPAKKAAPAAKKAAPAPVSHPPKVTAYLAVAESAGWSADAVVAGPTVTITSERTDETVIVSFTDGNTAPGTMWFIRKDGSRVRLRNISAAKKQMTLESESRPVPTTRSGAPRRTSQPFTDEERPQQDLPFDPATANDAEILEHFAYGATLTWRATGGRQTAVILPKHPATKIDAKRNLGFMSVDGRFRSVALANMLRVEPLTLRQAEDAVEEFKALANTK